MAVETELKLGIRRGDLPKLRAHPLLATVRHHPPVRVDNTYYDTQDETLARHGIALRLRRMAGRTLLTVKTAAPSRGGLSSRQEWEAPWPGTFDFAFVENDAVRERLEKVRERLEPRFRTRFRREIWELPCGEGHIEIALDLGRLEAGAAKLPIHELELEAYAVPAAELLTLARARAQDISLWPENRSKAERALQLAAGTWAAPVKAIEVELDPKGDPLAALRALADEVLAHWSGNLALIPYRHDPEYLHQIRVALRRRRALLQIFEPVTGPEFAAQWRERLGELAAELGQARDLDVLLDELLTPALERCPVEREALGELAARLSSERDKLRRRSGRLDPGRHGRVLLDFLAALEALPGNALIRASDLRHFARDRLEALRKKARRRFAAHLAEPSPETKHRLRIALKKLRYGLEFFQSLWRGKTTARALARLKRALDVLGHAQDWHAAQDMLTQRQKRHPDERLAAAVLLAWHHERIARNTAEILGNLEDWLEDDLTG